MLDAAPKYDFELEQALLGAALSDRAAFERVSPFLRPEHFADPLHGKIYGCVAGLTERGQPVSVFAVRSLTAEDPAFAEVGGAGYLVRLLSGAVGVSAADAEAYARSVALQYKRRQAEETFRTLPDEELGGAMEALGRDISALTARGAKELDGVVLAHTLAGQAVPQRQWIVPDWLPTGQVTLLSGDGGIGKSLLALQLMVAGETGTPWIGLPVERVPSFGLFAEDDDAELHHRLVDVCRAAGVGLADLPNMAWRSSVADQCELVEVNDRGAIVPTAYFKRLERTVVELGARLVVLDAATNLFGGDEIRRRHVNGFLVLLRQLAARIDGAVLLLAHPSVSGMASKSGMSGSTHWNNGVRSRLYFRSGEGDAEGEEDADPEARVLTRMKANHAPAGGTIKVRWNAGAFVPVSAPDFVDRIEINSKVDKVFLRLLREAAARGANVSPSPTSHNAAPTVFAKDAGREAITRKGFQAAMDRLLKAGAIDIETYGKPSDPRKRLVVK